MRIFGEAIAIMGLAILAIITLGCREDVEIEPMYVHGWVVEEQDLNIRLLINKNGRYTYSCNYRGSDNFYKNFRCHEYDGVLYLDGGFPPLYDSKPVTAKVIEENLWIEGLCLSREE